MSEVNGMMVVDRMLREHGLVADDEVWVHGMWTPAKWCACVMAKVRGKRLVRMTHGALSPVYLTRQSRWKKWLVKPIERLMFALADRIVVTGEWEAEWAREWGIRRAVEVIDLKQFFKFDLPKCVAKMEAIRHRAAGEKVKVLYLGRPHPLKGIDVLRKVAEILPDVELREVYDHFGDALEQDWKWADILVLPTLSENFGLVVAEALSRGIPAVTTDGAPAWANQEGVIYIKGYINASFPERVNLLAQSLLSIVSSPNSQQEI